MKEEARKVLTYEEGKTETTSGGYGHDPVYIGVDHIEYSIADLMFDYPDAESYKQKGAACKKLKTKTIYEGGETLQFRFQRATQANDEEEIRWCADPAVEIWTLQSAKRYVEFANKAEKKWEKTQEKAYKTGDTYVLRPFDCPVGLTAMAVLMGAINVASVYYMEPGGQWKRKVLVDRENAVSYAEWDEGNEEYWVHLDPPETS